MGTLDTDSDMDTDSDTAMDYCTARGLLMLSLRLRPIPTFSTVDSDTPDTAMESMDMDTDSDTDTDSAMVSITARGLLMLRPIPTSLRWTRIHRIWTGTPRICWTPSRIRIRTRPWCLLRSRLHQDLSVNQLGQKWIVISLNFPSPVLQFQCYHTKSLVMVSRKQ